MPKFILQKWFVEKKAHVGSTVQGEIADETDKAWKVDMGNKPIQKYVWIPKSVVIKKESEDGD